MMLSLSEGFFVIAAVVLLFLLGTWETEFNPLDKNLCVDCVATPPGGLLVMHVLFGIDIE
jgi:hypothetical protein